MNHLTRADYAAALSLLARLEPAASAGLRPFARAAVALVTDYVASELTTLSVCDLATGHCGVAGLAGVRQCQGTARYAHCDRRAGLEHAIALPLHRDGRTLVSLVLNRRGLDFSERDRERLELLRPHLAFLYRLVVAAPAGAPVQARVGEPAPETDGAGAAMLTPREHEVMHWLARGKTDAEIAALLSLSTRTVHKHLEHIYVKLGVETRTAAVMRVLSARRPVGPLGAARALPG